MSLGFASFRNSASEILIDQNFRNVEVVASGTLTVNNIITSGVNYSTLTMPSGINIPLVLWQFPINSSLIFYPGRHNLTEFQMGVVGAASVSLPYLICDIRSGGDAGGGHGFAVWNASSQLVFSSSRRYLRGISSYENITSRSQSGNQTTGLTITFSPSLPTGAYIQISRLRRYVAPGATEVGAYGFRRPANNQFSFPRTLVSAGRPGFDAFMTVPGHSLGQFVSWTVFNDMVNLIGE